MNASRGDAATIFWYACRARAAYLHAGNARGMLLEQDGARGDGVLGRDAWPHLALSALEEGEDASEHEGKREDDENHRERAMVGSDVVHD